MENAACHFVHYTGPLKGDAETFRTARITIGRAAGNDFQLDPRADQAGAHHAEILLEEGGVYFLYDLGTKAGTYVNGERVHERCSLMNEDYIRFSQDGPEIIFRHGVAGPGKQKLPLVFPVTAEMEFFSGSDAGRIFPINAAVVTNIGRRAEVEIPLDPRGDMIVSGNHCNIRYLDGHFVLTDKSRNGTYVNGDLVDQPMEIIDGDVIMLGDGGPQARFHVDLAKRHYPNHRPLSPAKPPKTDAPSVSAMALTKPKPAEPKPSVPEKPLASAAPFASGNPNTESKLTDAAAAVAGAGALSAAASAAGSGVAGAAGSVAGGAGAGSSEVEAISSLETPRETASIAGENAASSPPANRPGIRLPLASRIGFKPGKKVIYAAIGVVALIAVIALISGGDEEGDVAAERGDYSAALKDLKAVESGAGYTVKLPESWAARNTNGKISAESQDKEVAVDCVRDARLTPEKVKEILGRNEATVKPETRTVKSARGNVTISEATIGSVHRMAALHQAGGATPALALLEATEASLKNLGTKGVDQLLVDNVELANLPAAPASSPTAAPAVTTPAPELPTPVAAATATPVVTAAVSPTPVPTAAPSPSPTPAAADGGTTAPQVDEQTVVSKALKISVNVPKVWKGSSDEGDGMVTLSDNKGLEVRIARDDNQLDPRGTFDAMKEDGWTEDGAKTNDPRFQAAEFSKDGQNLMLVLIPEKSKKTLLIYATSAADFTQDQRYSISNIIGQVLPE